MFLSLGKECASRKSIIKTHSLMCSKLGDSTRMITASRGCIAISGDVLTSSLFRVLPWPSWVPPFDTTGCPPVYKPGMR